MDTARDIQLLHRFRLFLDREVMRSNFSYLYRLTVFPPGQVLDSHPQDPLCLDQLLHHSHETEEVW